MSAADPTPSNDDPILAAKRQHWRRRQRVLFWIAGVLLVANIIRTAWPLIEEGSRQVRQWYAERKLAAEEAVKAAAEVAARKRRLAAQTTDLPTVDRVDVYSLDDRLTDHRRGFPMYPGGDFAAIHAQTTILGDEAEEIARLWRACEFGEYSILMRKQVPEYPQYGVRFFRSGQLLFAAPLYWGTSVGQTSVADGPVGDIAYMFWDPDDRLLSCLQSVIELPPRENARHAGGLRESSAGGRSDD